MSHRFGGSFSLGLFWQLFSAVAADRPIARSSVARSIARPIARSIARSLARSLGRSVDSEVTARYLAVTSESTPGPREIPAASAICPAAAGRIEIVISEVTARYLAVTSEVTARYLAVTFENGPAADLRPRWSAFAVRPTVSFPGARGPLPVITEGGRVPQGKPRRVARRTRTTISRPSDRPNDRPSDQPSDRAIDRAIGLAMDRATERTRTTAAAGRPRARFQK